MAWWIIWGNKTKGPTVNNHSTRRRHGGEKQQARLAQRWKCKRKQGARAGRSRSDSWVGAKRGYLLIPTQGRKRRPVMGRFPRRKTPSTIHIGRVDRRNPFTTRPPRTDAHMRRERTNLPRRRRYQGEFGDMEIQPRRATLMRSQNTTGPQWKRSFLA